MDSRSCASNSLFQVSPSAFVSFLDTLPKGAVITDLSYHIQYVNHNAATMLGLSNQQLLGCSISTLLGGELPVFSADGRGAAGSFECVLLTTGSCKMPVEVSYNQIEDEGRCLVFFMLEDISERVDNQRRLYQQSITDSLTGLFNRRHFDERLDQEFGRASRYHTVFSVVIIDIDGFKQANDLYGHGYGDQVLQVATSVFRETFRDEDTLYRYGGDEFAMILPETTKKGASEVAERLREQFFQRCSDENKNIQLSLSVGIASHPEDAADAKRLISVADRRMYFAKENGGNRISAYDVLSEASSEVDQLLQSLGNLTQMMERSRGSCSVDALGHSQEMRALGVEIGRMLGLSNERLQVFEQAAMLHDIGTIHLPKELLQKKGELSEAEWRQIRQHTTIGEGILDMIISPDRKDLMDLKNIVAQHHESVDGSGYPRGLLDNEIMLEAKILAVTDAYGAMLTDRPYRSALSKKEALSELKNLSGSRFSPKVVDAFVQLEESGVSLSSDDFLYCALGNNKQ